MDVRSLSHSRRRCTPHHFRTEALDYRTHSDSLFRVRPEQIALQLMGECAESRLRKLVTHSVASAESQRHHDVVLAAEQPISSLNL